MPMQLAFTASRNVTQGTLGKGCVNWFQAQRGLRVSYRYVLSIGCLAEMALKQEAAIELDS